MLILRRDRIVKARTHQSISLSCGSESRDAKRSMNRTRLGIIQSNYIPWRGYFHFISSCDIFVLFDTAQYTKRDWRNRNFIVSRDGVQLLSIPVSTKGKFKQSIYETKIVDSSWQRRHWNSLVHSYARAEHFKSVATLLEPIYLEKKYDSLSEVNKSLIQCICQYLDIRTKIVDASSLRSVTGKNEQLISYCRQLGATDYISGPAANTYISPDLFSAEGVSIQYHIYPEYKPYKRVWPNESYRVSIVDLLFNCGPMSKDYLQ